MLPQVIIHFPDPAEPIDMFTNGCMDCSDSDVQNHASPNIDFIVY